MVENLSIGLVKMISGTLCQSFGGDHRCGRCGQSMSGIFLSHVNNLIGDFFETSVGSLLRFFEQMNLFLEERREQMRRTRTKVNTDLIGISLQPVDSFSRSDQNRLLFFIQMLLELRELLSFVFIQMIDLGLKIRLVLFLKELRLLLSVEEKFSLFLFGFFENLLDDLLSSQGDLFRSSASIFVHLSVRLRETIDQCRQAIAANVQRHLTVSIVTDRRRDTDIVSLHCTRRRRRLFGHRRPRRRELHTLDVSIQMRVQRHDQRSKDTQGWTERGAISRSMASLVASSFYSDPPVQAE